MHYYLNGELVDPWTPQALPSPTTILDVRFKPSLHAWREKMIEENGLEWVERYVGSKQDRGTRVHQACEDHMMAVTPTYLEDEDLPFYNGFINWLEKYQPTDYTTEEYVESKKYGYAGRRDIRCKLDGKWWVLDIKTSARPDHWIGLQLAAYERADFETLGVHAKRGVIQLTDKTKKGWKFIEYKDRRDFQDFLACKRLLDRERKYTKPPKTVIEWNPGDIENADV